MRKSARTTLRSIKLAGILTVKKTTASRLKMLKAALAPQGTYSQPSKGVRKSARQSKSRRTYDETKEVYPAAHDENEEIKELYVD
jgi:hypothetical protein